MVERQSSLLTLETEASPQGSFKSCSSAFDRSSSWSLLNCRVTVNVQSSHDSEHLDVDSQVEV